MTKPMFFRTKRANFDVIDAVLDAKPDRALTVPLIAEPFGYGLPETGNAVITNSPISGTNQMAFKFGAIKGDVATPLRLSFTDSVDALHRIVFASLSLMDGTTGPSTPYWKSATADATSADEAGEWDMTDAADANAIGANSRTMTRVADSGGNMTKTPHLAAFLTWAVPPGNYRLFARVFGTGWVRLLNGSGKTAAEARLISPGKWTWNPVTDVPIAMPGGRPPTDLRFGLIDALANAPYRIEVFFDPTDDEDNGGTIALDGYLLIPVSRPGALSRFGYVSFPAGYTAKTVVVDGINGDRRYALATKDSVQQFLPPSDVGGAAPMVVPGAENTLFLMATVNPGAGTVATDSKSSTITVNYTYLPRYLSADRPNLT
jgi:hypothetical protein